MIAVRAVSKSFFGRRPFRELARHPFTRRRVDALTEVDLRVGEGELVALVGPNGAGKTTLIKILCALIVADRGEASVTGADVVRDSLAVRRATGLVSADERSFYWRLTGRQNLEFFAALQGLGRGAARTRAGELLERVDLASAAGTPFAEYSTGMRQKLALCRGLLHQPRVLLLDEPTRGIDLAALRVLRAILREHAARGGAALLASHDLAEIEALECTVALIRAGKIGATGSIRALRASLAIAETVELLFAGGPDEAKRAAAQLAGDVRVTSAREDAGSLVVTLASDAVIGAVIATLQGAGFSVTRVRPRGAGLEAVLDASA